MSGRGADLLRIFVSETRMTRFISESRPRAVYKVCFEEKWQGRFEDLNDALAYGRVVGETGRLAHVVRNGFFPRLIAVYPESMTEVGTRLWNMRAIGAGGGG